MQVVVNKDNPFTFGNTSDSNVKTRVVSIDLSNPCTGQKAVVQNTSKPIEVEMEGNIYVKHGFEITKRLLHLLFSLLPLKLKKQF